MALLAREHIEFHTDQLGFNLLDASVNLRNVRVRSTQWPDAPVFATIGRAQIDLSLLQLLRGHVMVQSGLIDDVDIHYVVDGPGRDNLPRPPADPNTPQQSIDYLVSSLRIDRAHVRYENRAEQIDARLPFSSIEVAGNDLTDRHEIRFDASRADVRVRTRQVPIDRLAGLVDLGKDDVTIERLEVDAAGSLAALTGTIKQFDAPVADLALTSTVDAKTAASVATFDETVSGSITIDAAVAGPLSTPAIDLRVSGLDLRFRDLHDIQLKADATYDLATRLAAVSSLQLQGPWGAVTGEGNVTLDDSGQSHVQADIDRVDAEAVMRGLHLSFVAATRVTGRIRAEWPGFDYLRVKGDTDATLRPTRSRMSQSTMPLGGRIVARGTGTRIDAQLLQIAVPGGEVNGAVAVTIDRRLQGQVTGRATNVGELTASIEAFTGQPRGSLLPTPLAGRVEINAQLAGSVNAPTVAATVVAPALTVGTEEGIALTAEASYGPRAITISQADLIWDQARAHVDGRVGLGQNQPIDLRVAMDNFELASLLRAMKMSDLPVSGLLSAHGSAGGTATRPMVAITAQGSSLVAYEEEFGSLNADLRLDGRKLTVTDLVVDKPQPDQPGQLTATATYNLDRETYTFDLQSRDLRLVGLRLPDGHRIRGDVQQLAATGTGSIDSPEGTVDLTVDALEIESGVSPPDEAPLKGSDPISLGRVVVKAVAENNEATVTASSERFNLDADALVGLKRPWPARLKLHADGLDLAALPVQAAPDSAERNLAGLEGQLRASIEASGTLAEPEKGRASIELESLEGLWNRRPFLVTSPSPIRYADERLTVDSVELAAGDTTLTVSGDLPLADDEATGKLAVDLRGSLATIAPYLPPETNLAADGAIELTGSLRGTLKRIEPDLMLTVDRGLVLTPTLEPGFSKIRLRARVEDGAANIDELTAQWGTASIEASGRIPLAAMSQLPVDVPSTSAAASFKAAILNLDPGVIPGTPPQLSGRISAEAQLTAANATIGALEGQITFPELDVAFSGLDLAQQEVSTITIGSGSVRVDQMNLSGSAGEIHARGSVGLDGDRTLNVDVDGGLNVAAVSLLTDRIRAEGDSALKLMVRGTIAKPDVTGTADLVNVRAVSDEPNIAAENVYAHVDLEGRRLVLARLDADVNGGTLKGSGDVTLGEGGLSDINVEISANDVAYDAPLDLRSISDSTITVSKKGEDFIIGGQVTIDEAGLTGDINFDTGLLAVITSPRSLDLAEERNPMLERVLFDVDVNTATPVLVDNNIARAEIATDLNVVGTPYDTGLLGELRLLEGSEIRLNERRYEVERGTITFSDERRISPSFDLLLNTTAGAYDITVAVTGTAEDTETTLTSSPTLPEPDIMALLVTGRTLDDMRGEGYEVARTQVLSYLAGRVGSSLGRGLQQATGLSEVRIEPTLIANEADPSARLTVGQEITDDLKLVYSTNLTDSNDQIWVAEYDVTRRFQTRAVRQEDSSYRLDFRHDVRFGGRPEPRRTPRVQPEIAEVAINVPTGIDESLVRKEFGIKAGDPYDFFEIRNGIERVETSFVDRGYLQSRVRLERGANSNQARLALTVAPGPRIDLQFVGAMPPANVVEQVRTQWHRGVFDKQRADDGADSLRQWLMDDNYLQAKIDHQVQDISDQERRVTFQIQPGPRSQKVVLAFEGASGVDPDELDKIVDQQKLERRLFTDPLVVTELLERYYREQGFLSAEIDEPRYEYQGDLARVVLPVREGPKYEVRHVTVSGNRVYATDVITSQLPVIAGQAFSPAAAENALDKIRDLYWARGYNDVRSDYELAVDRASGRVDVAFSIREGRQSVVAGVTITGNERVSDHLVQRQIQLVTAQPLDLSALARSRRNLYGTGAFSVVDITRTEVGADRPTTPTAPVAAGGSDSDGALASQTKPVEINVALREVQPIQIRYGASFDTERGPGVIFDIANHNSLGKAREIGLRSRYDRQLHEGRLYFNQPALTYFPKTTAAVYFREQLNPPTELTDPFNISRKGASIQQEQTLQNLYVLTYGYRLERVHSLTPLSDGTLLDEAMTISPLTTTLTRETRDDVLDASRGTFLSQAFSYSPGWLGSDRPFIRYLGQYFHYFPLRPPTRRPFTNEMIRPRLVYATGVRIGLARGIGGVLPRSERFYAGGSSTLRGFAQNAVGSIGPNRIPIGGEAMLVLNNEVRMPLVSVVDGVVFLDTGNVFDTVRDFSLTSLRTSTGIGLRVRTPWVLLRGDYGIVLDPRPGEPRGRFYFSIGQAF